MPLVTITNKTSSRLPVGSTVGVLGPNKTIQLQLTSDELERSRDQLISLAASGNIEWSTSPTSTNETSGKISRGPRTVTVIMALELMYESASVQKIITAKD